MKQVINTLLFLSLFIGSLFTEDIYAYEGAAAFLKRGMSARALGLGGAYTALAVDPSAIYWNPAGIANGSGLLLQISDLKDTQFYTNISDVNYPQIAATLSPTHKFFTSVTFGVGVGFSGFFVNGIEHYDDQSNYLGDLNYSEVAYFMSYALAIDNIQLGVSYKYLQQDFGLSQRHSNLTENKKGTDIGLRYTPVRFLTLAITIMDKLKVGEFEYVPKMVTSGIALNFSRLSFVADYTTTEISFARVKSGLEYRLGSNNQYSIRVGVRDIPIQDDNEKISDIIELNSKISMGFGYNLVIGNDRHGLTFDIGMQQEIAPSILMPYSRIVATTITIR
jgi:hypothetical protein